jgi:hypothetical protein
MTFLNNKSINISLKPNLYLLKVNYGGEEGNRLNHI